MDSQNPYSAPQTNVQAAPASVANGVELTASSIVSLLKTRSWLKIIAISTFVVPALMIFAIYSVFSRTTITDIPPFVILILALFVIGPTFIGIAMLSYSKKIKAYTSGKSEDECKSMISTHNIFYCKLSLVSIISFITLIVAIFLAVTYITERASRSPQRSHMSGPY